MSFTCSDGTVAHSNVTHATTPCAGSSGDLCPFACDEGYLAIGQHACQSYTTMSGTSVLSKEFFGGRCERLCPGAPSTCPSGHTPVRINTSTTAAGGDDSSCYTTKCFTPDEALRRLARGAYSLWRKGRLDATGIYSGSVNPSAPSGAAQSDQAHIGINGVGLMFECVAAEMGWITVHEAAIRVNHSLTALAEELPGFTLARQTQDGWIPTFFNRTSCAALGKNQPYTVLDSGLNSAGVLFARTYFAAKTKANNAAKVSAADVPSDLAASIARLGKKVFNLVRFENVLCDASSVQNTSGMYIPFTFDNTVPHANCGASSGHFPKADGY